MPLNYARFLDYAAKRVLLRKVGGGYMFVHRLLLEHFAALDPESPFCLPSGVPDESSKLWWEDSGSQALSLPVEFLRHLQYSRQHSENTKNDRSRAMQIDQLDTPVAVVRLDRLERNIAALQAYLSEHGIANRPHIKTHKIPEIAHMQLRAGAAGITCQKLGEVEVMIQAGIRDIFLPYNLLGAPKLERLAGLLRRASVSVTADSELVVQGLAGAARQAGTELPVLVEFDGGMGRCGVQTPQQAADLARAIARSDGLRYGGLMTYPSNEQTDAFVRATRELLSADGLAVERVSGGGTPRMWQAHTTREVNEYRAGTYVYGDRAIIKSGAMRLEECAFHVITTVVSRPTADRGILDGGSKTFSSDLLGLEGHGLILEYPEARFYGLSEEHGHVDFAACARKPAVGERVTVIPNHCCVVSNLFNQIVGVRGETVEVMWPVAGRGALQ